MTPHDIAIIRSGFATLARDPDGFEADFYALLFHRAPSLRGLFKSELKGQSRTLVGMLAVALNTLGRMQTIVATVQDLGRSHTAYGIRPGHYAVVGEALLATIAQRLGPAFTDEASEAWRDAYVSLSETMMTAAYNPIDLAA